MKNATFEQMKRLYLVRHAKASWEEAGIPDSKRKLLQKGIDRTKKIIEYFLTNSVQPDLIIASHATRALDTAKLIANGLNYPEEKIVSDKRIYNNEASVLFDVLYELDKQISEVALVGHNPAITDFANQYLSEKIMFMPTSAVVCVEFTMDSWIDIHSAPHELCFYVYPKML